MLRFVTNTIIIMSIISLTALPQNSGTTKVNNTIVEFPQKAYSGGMMEIQLGKLAQQKASSYKVKEFGERMISDHTPADQELKNIAQKSNILLPDTMLAADQKTYNELSGYSGGVFDKNYMDKMVEDHKEDIKEFEEAIQNVNNQEIREWAKKTLPVLRQHLKLAQKTLNELKPGK